MLSAAPQGFEQILLWRRVEQIAEQGKAIPDRRQHRETVVLAAQMRRRARPSPILGAFDQSRPHRIERHVTQRRREMRLVHGDGAEAALPSWCRPIRTGFPARVHHAYAGIIQARRKRTGHQVHVVRHQAHTSTSDARQFSASRSR